LSYKGTGNITALEGMVRLIACGINYTWIPADVHFPGLGGEHQATMINSAATGGSLLLMVNNVDMMTMVPMVGCGDHVTGFQTPCTTAGIGW
jgi:hypothetical protein